MTDPDIGREHNVILGFNEPNQADQANIPPDVAALAWIEHREKYADKVYSPDLLPIKHHLKWVNFTSDPAMGHAWRPSPNTEKHSPHSFVKKGQKRLGDTFQEYDVS